MLSSSFIRHAFILGLAAAPATGAVRTGELEVREGKAGVPCFTIPEAEERRAGAPDFQSISVAESGPGAKTPLWTMSMPKQRTFPVSFRMCIPYAGRLPVLPQTAAAPLQPGRAYDVTIEARSAQQAGGPHTYRARFCLVPQRQGDARVRQIGAGSLDPKARLVCPSPSRP
jgi:hypothetical protein